MKAIHLSRNARNLLYRRANGEHVEVTPQNLEAYRELARAGVMYPLLRCSVLLSRSTPIGRPSCCSAVTSRASLRSAFTSN